MNIMKKFKITIFIILTSLILTSCIKDDNNLDKKEYIDTVSTNSNLISMWVEWFKKELEKKDWILIDLRTIEELQHTWIIEWALNIDYYSSYFKDNIWTLDKDKKYLIYCRSWHRSWITLNTMKELWFTNVVNLEWWINSWTMARESVMEIKSVIN